MYLKLKYLSLVITTLSIASVALAQQSANPMANGRSGAAVQRTSQGTDQQGRSISKADKNKERIASKLKPTIYEFGDLQCSDSAEFAANGRGELLSKYVQTGKVAYEFHDFPLDAHPLAPKCAEIARCAGKRAGEVRDYLLANQATLKTEAQLIDSLQQFGIDRAAAEQCLSQGTSAQAVQKDHALGKQLGVRATPSLVLGFTDPDGTFKPTKVVRADRPLNDTMGHIDELLSTKTQ